MTHAFVTSNHDASSGSSNDNVELNTKHRSTADRHNSGNGRNEQKRLLYSRCVKEHENQLNKCYLSEAMSHECRNVNITVKCTAHVKDNYHTNTIFFNAIHGMSPTVNISWFIAKAYLANLYYTTQRDVSLTIQTCDDVIDVYRQSRMNQDFAERAFPVVLSTTWTSIYDKEIQALLGFYSLCTYVLDTCSSRSVYLGVCPVQFAHYVKVRMVKAHMFSDWTRYVDMYNEHLEVSMCSRRVTNGGLVLSRVLQLLVSL